MKHYFLGAAANCKHAWRRVFARGSKKDAEALKTYLGKKYSGEAILMKNGRSALCLALKTYLEPRSGVLINGFTCYAVVEAVLRAGMAPVYVDISATDLNFNTETLERALASFDGEVRGIIVQNTLGNPVDMAAIEKFADEHGLMIFEDLAHSVGAKYADGREAGTVGTATALSFGKEKSVDTILGGAVVFRDAVYKVKGARVNVPQKPPRTSDNLRARCYPLFGAMYRGLSYVKLNGVLMRLLLGLHLVERSADNRLDLDRRMSNFEAKLALAQLKALEKRAPEPLRTFYLLDNREEILGRLRRAGYYFEGFWYECPISPARYYQELRYPEEECPVAVAVSQKIINFPNYYTKAELAQAEQIVREHGKFWKEAN